MPYDAKLHSVGTRKLFGDFSKIQFSEKKSILSIYMNKLLMKFNFFEYVYFLYVLPPLVLKLYQKQISQIRYQIARPTSSRHNCTMLIKRCDAISLHNTYKNRKFEKEYNKFNPNIW